MSRVFVAGVGAVSPAGWDVVALREALVKGEPLPVQRMQPPGGQRPIEVRLVPSPAQRPAFLGHPRLRRTSPISHYAASAALEATARLRAIAQGTRFGIVVCLQSGCVQFCCRFFDETLKDPATASPLVFPETVYAAPASHVAALLENVTLVNTLVGDSSVLLSGVALAARWLHEERVDACLVIGAEEPHWLVSDALWHLDRQSVLTGGAGAVCLCRDAAQAAGVELAAITDAQTYLSGCGRMHSARAMRDQFGGTGAGELLCDGLGAGGDAAEQAAWADWIGTRLSPKRVLGEGLMASAAWQCVAACDAVAGGRFAAANVSLVGPNQQAIGARFVTVTNTEP